MALYLEDLQKTLERGCGNPNCTHNHSTLILKSGCHWKNGVNVVVTKGSDVLAIRCSKCDKLIVEIFVAHKPIPEGVSLSA
jgi:hypothetical protein